MINDLLTLILKSFTQNGLIMQLKLLTEVFILLFSVEIHRHLDQPND